MGSHAKRLRKLLHSTLLAGASDELKSVPEMNVFCHLDLSGSSDTCFFATLFWMAGGQRNHNRVRNTYERL